MKYSVCEAISEEGYKVASHNEQKLVLYIHGKGGGLGISVTETIYPLLTLIFWSVPFEQL